MRVKILGSAMAAALYFGAPVYGQTPNKVGIISVQQAIVATQEGQKAVQQLDAKFQPKQKEFDQRQNEVARLQEQLNKGGNVLSEDKRIQLQREMDQKKKQLERDMSDTKDELVAAEQQALQGLGEKMKKILYQFAKEKGYSLIFDYNADSTVLYAATAIDVTQDIVALYDKTNPSASEKHAQNGRGVERANQ